MNSEPKRCRFLVYEGEFLRYEVFIDTDIENGNGKGGVTVHDYLLGAVRSYPYPYPYPHRLRQGGFFEPFEHYKKRV